MKKVNSKHATSEKRTSDIIRAALECFTELGFNDTSMADICTRAQASTGSVYHHFKSKEQLAAAVYLDGIELYQTGILKILEEETDAFKGISSIIEYHLRWVQNNLDWAQFLFQTRHFSFLLENEERLLTLNIRLVQGIMDWFKPYMTTGIIRPVSWDIVMALLLGPCQEYTRFYLSKTSPTNIDEAIHDLSLAAWRSLSKEN